MTRLVAARKIADKAAQTKGFRAAKAAKDEAGMNIEGLLKHIKRRYGDVPDYPWAKYPDYAVLRHAHNRKWYCLAMRIQGVRLGLKADGFVEVINVKAQPAMIGSLRALPGALPAYHMNKEHWLSILLDGGLSEREILAFVRESFELTR